MSFLQCGNAVHYYRLRQSIAGRFGAGARPPLLVLIHALGTDHSIWDRVLDALPPELPVLVYDQRGQGLSELGTGAYDIADLCEDLRSLLEALGAGDVVLAGLSLGGLVAQRFALSHPERVRGLCLCATAARIGSAELWRSRAEQVERAGVAAIAGGVIERWFSPGFRLREPVLVRGYRTLLERSSSESYLAGLGLLANTDLTREVGDIRVPTLVIAGEADVATPPSEMRRLAEAIPGAEFLVASGAGHLLCVEQPELVARAVGEFWTAKVAPAPAGGAPGSSLERGLSMRRAVLGPAHVDRALAAATDFDRDFQEYITRAAWGEIWARPGLPIPTRHLLTIVMLAALQRPEELAMHLEATRNTGVSLEEIREALMQVAVYAGVPAAHAAIRAAKRVLATPELAEPNA